MEQTIKQNDIYSAVKYIKEAIMQTRYRVMHNANREALALYYSVGGYLMSSVEQAQWGDKVVEAISEQLQQELPGLRGFSKANIKKMRIFYDKWKDIFGSLSTNQIAHTGGWVIEPQKSDNQHFVIGSLSTNQFDKDTLEAFLTVQFTHHYVILTHTDTLEERLYYIRRIAKEFWSVDKLKYNLAEHLYEKEGSMPNNFIRTLTDKDQKDKARKAFRKNYKLDFIEINDPDEWDERRVEQSIVLNIKNFIMALGRDFSFIGNQYRLIVDEKEYFIDLLFFSRRLRSLVAIELKWTDFRPEYVGKMNFYLSALDDMVRLPYENPSIGIILCRGQKQRTVEYALRDTNKPMGVATYRAANELPEEYSQALEGLEGLKELL
ncbi:MAG: PDDEXK nuclease domain-containing protein [Prevotellaceae bacterium]|nr:PDDEXK nuclease domain-containing protein [Prevotellaceae bacterium]